MNATDHTGQTALHWSAVRGAVQVAELLLQEGARVDATDMYGYQVLTTSSFFVEICLFFFFVSMLLVNFFLSFFHIASGSGSITSIYLFCCGCYFFSY